jgi:CDP-diacylglycerol--serine O-phosphatidyltransferase
VPAATVFAYPAGLHAPGEALLGLAMVLVPALLMVSTIRFRSFKTIDLRTRRPYKVIFLVAAGIMLITTSPRVALVAMAYSYLVSAFVEMLVVKFRHREGRGVPDSNRPDPSVPAHDRAH